jgi:hypothetical protein
MVYKKHPKEGYEVYLSAGDIKELKRLETGKVLERNKEILAKIQQNIDDIWNYYTADSEDKILIRASEKDDHENIRPLQVKGMKRKPSNVEKTLKEKVVFSIDELRKLENW